MASEAALSLLNTREATKGKEGGILTPATAIGETLEKRLAPHGVHF
jgi:short subunit dehydrogenase-like uncharacterized protein